MSDALVVDDTIKVRSMVLDKISKQFNDAPEQRLFFAIIEQAIKDLRSDSNEDRLSAVLYLRGPMVHALICGIDPEWIRRILRKYWKHLCPRWTLL